MTCISPDDDAGFPGDTTDVGEDWELAVDGVSPESCTLSLAAEISERRDREIEEDGGEVVEMVPETCRSLWFKFSCGVGVVGVG